MEGGGYARFAAHAASLGIPWAPWTADESCPQGGVQDDIVVQEPFTPWCDLENPIDPTDPTNPGDPGAAGEQGGGGCGCSGAELNGMFTVLMAGLVLRRSRRD